MALFELFLSINNYLVSFYFIVRLNELLINNYFSNFLFYSEAFNFFFVFDCQMP